MLQVAVMEVLKYLFLLLLMLSATSADSTRPSITLPGCPASCGNISLPYPFGIKPGCFRKEFQLTCNDNNLFLGDNSGNTEVINITMSQVIVKAPIFIMPTDANESYIAQYWSPLNGGPYILSNVNGLTYVNSLVVIGCGISAKLTDPYSSKAISTCSSLCDSNYSLVEGMRCTGGNGCCSSAVDEPYDQNIRSYDIQFERLQGGVGGRGSGKAFLTSDPNYRFRKQDLISPNLIGGSSGVPLALYWPFISDSNSCDEAKWNMSTYACRSNNSFCIEQNRGGGYFCLCGSRDDIDWQRDGNPFISGGCPEVRSSPRGGFAFHRTKGAFYRTKGGYTFIGVMVAGGFFLLFMSQRFLCRRWKKRSIKKVRKKHFHKNRGLLLHRLISSDNDIADRTKIFSFEELAKATNNFDEARVLGRGGHGTVFKGILSDQRVVAIKKSKINVQSEIDQFLNEVVILSQINHRNVVKLFGCCLETEVPLLIYEFVSNGTLSDHLHLPDRRSSLSWEKRLRIARDASGALSYLHSAASISIFHRDVKSSNILLDDHYTAKVSDFGTSRSVPIDMTHVVTVVQGTFGYLDPEYYHTGQLTEKSDVYSFGVILVELLTGEKPISFTRPEEERNLCTHFLSALRDDRLSQILEARVMEEATREEIDTICRLAETCLKFKGEDRPTMKGVEVSLELLRRSKNIRSMSLMLSSDTKYDNYPHLASSEEMPGASNSGDQSMLSMTLPR